MQNLGNKRNFPPKFFLSVSPASQRRLEAGFILLLLALANLNASWAQVSPAPIGAPTTSPAATAQPSRGNVALPAGVNPSSLPPAVQQQINQAQQAGRNGANGQPGQGQPGQNGAAQFERANRNGQGQMSADSLNPLNPTVAGESDYERARRLEREELRRKIFGYSVFNDPQTKGIFAPNSGSMATPQNYVVGPGDVLNIQIYGYSEQDFSQKVSPEGNVYFAQTTGIGPVFVSGLTIEQVKSRLTSRLAKRYVGLRSSAYGPKNTFLEVSIGEIRSIRVTVTGEAVQPGTYPLSSLSTVMNAIYQAGGPNELGSFRKVQLIRNNKVIATLDLYDYLLSGTQTNDLPLRDNDNIRFTTYISRVEISGSIKRNNIFELLPGETLDRLLFYAGDFMANAYKGMVKVTRLTDRERKVIDVARNEFKTFIMQDGDLVSVEQLLDRFENQITIEGAVYRPGQYSLDQSRTLKQLISTAEGLRGDAFTGRVIIVRTREDLAIENITVNLTNILNGTAPDLILQREDQVLVPSRFDLAEQATVSVQGEVNNPAEAIPYMANMTLDDALLRTGGLKESAAASLVEVVRREKNADPRSKSSQVAQVFRFNVNRDLTLSSDENKFVLAPFDQIIVRRSPNYLVQTYAAVAGEVVIPGSYAIQSKDQKVSDIIEMAGGLTPFAYVEGATLVRRVTLSQDELTRRRQALEDIADNDNKSVIPIRADTLATGQLESIGINLKKILANPGSPEDILVEDGDVLRIPKVLQTVRVQGEVQRQNTVKYRAGQTFQDYISQSGGFTTKSQRRKSFVLYANGSVDRTRKFMFFNVYPRIEPGAEIVVPRRTGVRLTPQQILTTTTGLVGSLLTLVTTVLVLSRVR